MQRYIVSEQILGVMISNSFLNNDINELKLEDLSCIIRRINYQIQEQCGTIIDFSGKDVYRFIDNNRKYFCLDKDKIILSEYTENKINYDFSDIQDIFDTKFIAGLPDDIISVVNQNLAEI